MFTFDCTDENRQRLVQLASSIGKEIRLHLIDNETLVAFGHHTGVANFAPTLIRLIVPELLSGTAEKVLYLDSDVLCFGDISELLTLDFEDNIAAAVTDRPEFVKERTVLLGLKNGKYFNAGIIYIDIIKWMAATGMSAAAVKIVSTINSYVLDQDALNILLYGRVKYLDKRWNYMYCSVDELLYKGEVAINIPSPFTFVHFIGYLKLWHSAIRNDWQRHFLEIQSRTPWASTPLDSPNGRWNKWLSAKIMFRLGYYGAGMYWFFQFTYDMVVLHVYNKCLKKISSLPFFNPNFKDFLLSKTIKIS